MSKLKNVVMFACNQGGHFSQMMALKQLFGEYETVLVTDNEQATKERIPALKEIGAVEYAMSIANRRKNNKRPIKVKNRRLRLITSYFSLFLECRKIWKIYKPSVIISTGSNIAVVLFLYGWYKGSKLIFIESRAKVYSKTMTGKLVERISDKIFVQWPEMMKIYPTAEYCGVLV